MKSKPLRIPTSQCTQCRLEKENVSLIDYCAGHKKHYKCIQNEDNWQLIDDQCRGELIPKYGNRQQYIEGKLVSTSYEMKKVCSGCKQEYCVEQQKKDREYLKELPNLYRRRNK